MIPKSIKKQKFIIQICRFRNCIIKDVSKNAVLKLCKRLLCDRILLENVTDDFVTRIIGDPNYGNG